MQRRFFAKLADFWPAIIAPAAVNTWLWGLTSAVLTVVLSLLVLAAVVVLEARLHKNTRRNRGAGAA